MAYSENPMGTRTVARNRDAQQALMDAYTAAQEANRAIVEALLTNTGDTCNAIIQRAYTQLGYSAKNLRKAQTCLRTPPELQYMVDRQRRR